MPLLRRRRPLLRAAAVGGGAYLAGKHREAREQASMAPEPAPAPAAPPPAPPPQPAAAADPLDQLERLGKLHEQGVLTDDEFAREKAKVLGG